MNLDIVVEIETIVNILTTYGTLPVFHGHYISVQARRRNNKAKLIADAFLSGDDMPFANVLPAEVIRAIFQKHDSNTCNTEKVPDTFFV